MRVAYFNLVGGASGDMLLGALLDVGLELDGVIAGLSSLKVDGYELTSEPGTRGARNTGSQFSEGAPVNTTGSPGSATSSASSTSSSPIS